MTNMYGLMLRKKCADIEVHSLEHHQPGDRGPLLVRDALFRRLLSNLANSNGLSSFETLKCLNRCN